MTTTVKTGEVCHLNMGRGFGFIKPDAGDRDLFFHFRDLQFERPVKGDRVQFSVILDEVHGGYRASDVDLIG